MSSSDKTIRELIDEKLMYSCGIGRGTRTFDAGMNAFTAIVEEAVRRAVELRGSINPHWKRKTNTEIVAAVMGDKS